MDDVIVCRIRAVGSFRGFVCLGIWWIVVVGDDGGWG